jgi:uncharacterized membrane protein YidH (DUF202 family)|uniref:Uncharacterized protein n=1 Tax=viral metagenome TaxID=1070528 RepID=A0A6C0D3W3_9ZZZZ
MEEFLIISFFVSISYFVFKLVLNKIQKEKNKQDNSNLIRDSIYIFIITFGVIYLYSMFFKKGSGKTPVFTNEPGF